jgi:hypothetical protein
MERNISIKKRRWGVIINYSALILAVFAFEIIKYGVGLPSWIGFSLLGIFLLILILSFTYTFGNTGMWMLAHKKTGNLDEREIQVVTNAVRLSYSIFTIMVIVIVYLFAILGMGPFDVVIAATLLYLAHILPSSILAGTEKEV